MRNGFFVKARCLVMFAHHYKFGDIAVIITISNGQVDEDMGRNSRAVSTCIVNLGLLLGLVIKR